MAASDHPLCKSCGFLQPLYAWLDKATTCLQDPFLLIIRVYWGYGFFQAGWGKFGRIDQVVGFFTNIGIPLPTLNVYLVATVETVCGLLLLFGLGSRFVALPLAITMVVAYITTQQEALGTLFSDPSAFLEVDPFLFLFASLIVLCFGAGKWSVDHWVCHRKK